jgi:hypothetical protein
VAFVEDFAPFFAEFGVDVTLGAATFKGIFDKANFAALGGFVDADAPQVLCTEADAGAATLGQAITVDGNAYIVRGAQNDGTGLTMLQLEDA